jgi:hypothetical protein
MDETDGEYDAESRVKLIEALMVAFVHRAVGAVG